MILQPLVVLYLMNFIIIIIHWGVVFVMTG
jgi:hypothetical protein